MYEDLYELLCKTQQNIGCRLSPDFNCKTCVGDIRANIRNKRQKRPRIALF